MTERTSLIRVAGGFGCAILALATLLVHDVGYLLTQPFWLDEAWVAMSTRVPLGELTDVTAVSPTGWTALLRLVPVGGGGLRLLPMAFAMLTVLAAYWLGRTVWDSLGAGVVAGLLAAVSALLAPTALARGDLKQYTADAFVALLALALLGRLESSWSRWRLLGLAAAGPLGMLISHPAAFVVPAALLAVSVVQLGRRQWRRLLDCCVAGALAALGMGLVYLTLDRPHVVDSIQDYWTAFYLPWRDGVGATVRFLGERSVTLDGAGLGPFWLCLPLVALGIVVLVRVGRPAVALTVPLLGAGLLTASGLRYYPLLNFRTSHFLLTILAAVAALGVSGLVVLAGRRQVAAGVIIALAAVGGYAWAGSDGWRSHLIPLEDVRSQVRYLEDHRVESDVIVVDYGASFGFGYYYRPADPQLRPTDAVATQFVVDYPADARIVVMSGRARADIAAALARARAVGGPDARIWVVRAHGGPNLNAVWESVVPEATELDVGPDPLLLVE